MTWPHPTRAVPMHGIGCALVAVLAVPAAAIQVPTPDVVEEVKRLIAMVECREDGDIRFGSGIIVGASADSLHIATALHVVRPCRTTAGTLLVRLQHQPDEEIGGAAFGEADPTLDLAIFVVRAPGVATDSLPFDRLGDPAAMARGAGVFSLGWRDRAWSLNVFPEPFTEHRNDRLYYESGHIGPGHSGGALLNTDMLIVGMLRSDQPPFGEAISIVKVLERIRQWGHPVGLVSQTVPERLASLSLGRAHACALDAAGVAWCWGGSGAYGSPALGTGVQGAASMRVVGGVRFGSLVTGFDATCGLTAGGKAYCWGLSLGPAMSSTPVFSPRRVAVPHRFADLALGERHACGVTLDGAAWCWGDNELGQLGDGTRRNSVDPVRVDSDVEFAAISAGTVHTCGLARDGSAFCWGQNLSGEAGVGSAAIVSAPARVAGDLRFTTVSASPDRHTCGITAEGDAFCWGENHRGQLGVGSTENQHTPAAVAGGLKFASLATGAWFSCGLDRSGAAWCWGANDHGQLGDGSSEGSAVPVRVGGDLRFASLDSSMFHGRLSCALSPDGSPYCWGRTDSPRLVGSAFPVDVPVRTPQRIRP